jgi:hypothetical protein
MSASRYRDRHGVSGAKSDPGDAKVLADLVRTDRHNHRPAGRDSDLAGAVKILARAHQSMIWSRRQHASRLRSALREYYPAALAAFDDLTSGDAAEVLRAAPDPAAGAALSRTQIAAALPRGPAAPHRSAGRPGPVGELGDAPGRYPDAKSRRNYAGTSPITRASGTRRVVLARHARSKRLADAIYRWAFAALSASPGARAHYDARRAAGDTRHQALRALGNRLTGILHGCLTHHTAYRETTAWAHRPSTEKQQAA